MMTDTRPIVIIIGAGASGLTAAIHAARAGATVRILEHKEAAGKKLLLTGNGKCNLSNEDLNPRYYRGSHPEFAETALSSFGLSETRDFFRSIGILLRSKNGYLYPQNGEAVGVRDALVAECDKLGVEISYEIGIKKIVRDDGDFLLDTKQGEFRSRSVVLATGGSTLKRTGSDGSGLLYLERFRHPIKDVVPSLLQMKAKEAFFPEIAGIRADASLCLFVDGEENRRERGELQLTEYGISGIPVFQLSRYAAEGLKKGKNVSALISFLPENKDPEELVSFYESLFRDHPDPVGRLLAGSLPHKLCGVILKEAGVKDLPGNRITREEIRRIVKMITAFPVTITGMYREDQAQVTAGGVDPDYVDPETMESTLEKGLFFCGEVLDIDGPCGGYNLQWAWSSGAAAGIHAAHFAQKTAKRTSS